MERQAKDVRLVAEFMLDGMTAEDRRGIVSDRDGWIEEAELQIAHSDGISQNITGAEVVEAIQDMIAESA